MEDLGHANATAVLFDLGVSSPQLDVAERGFSYRHDGPLDMRMDRRQRRTAADVVNGYDDDDLAAVLRAYGDERFATRIARAIVAARPIASTAELAEIVRDAIPAPARRTGGHPAKRTFQALRIEVNDELAILAGSLDQAIDFLAPGGRCAVLAYHSGEDRIVKERFRHHATGGVTPPPGPAPAPRACEPTVRLVRGVPEDADGRRAGREPAGRERPPARRREAGEAVGMTAVLDAAPSGTGRPRGAAPPRRRPGRRCRAWRRPPPARPAPRTPRPSRPPLRVVEPRRRLRTGPTVVVGAVLAFAIAFAVVVFQAQLVQGQRHLDDLGSRIDQAADDYRRLRWDVAELESPERIVDAAGALGMVPPPGVTYLTPSGTVVVDGAEDPVAATDETGVFAETKPYLDGTG